jgi:hypothetical protein
MEVLRSLSEFLWGIGRRFWLWLPTFIFDPFDFYDRIIKAQLPEPWRIDIPFPSGIAFYALIGLLLWAAVLTFHEKRKALGNLALDPDASAREAYRRLILHARWGLGRDPADKGFYEDISKELRDKARLGLFRVWAREDGGAFAPPNAIREIIPDEWDHLNFCLASCMGAGPWARLLDYSGERLNVLIDASINQAQLRSVWPAANIFQKLMDRTYGKRQTFYEAETKGSEENVNW